MTVASERLVLPMPIVNAVAEESGWPVERILSDEKHRSVSHARHVVMWFVRREGYSYPEIATMLERSEHSTARHGVAKIDELLLAKNPYTTSIVAGTKKRLKKR